MTMQDMPGGCVLIVEDHTVLAHTLAVALRAEGWQVEALLEVDRETVLREAGRLSPRVVLLDLDLGEYESGVTLIDPLRALGADVLVVSGIRDRLQLAEALEAGAAGFVEKAEPFERLAEAVADLMRGEPVMPSATRDEMLHDLRINRAERKRIDERFARLSETEKEVLRSVIDGKSAETIASERVVSLATVRSQIQSILQKLGVSSQLAAAALAREAGWPGS